MLVCSVEDCNPPLYLEATVLPPKSAHVIFIGGLSQAFHQTPCVHISWLQPCDEKSTKQPIEDQFINKEHNQSLGHED
ncbi:hypothetical protein RchiOBHm_Chr5g0079961 [Rosa chinensis]|uniref:Uncharacterized protein n=1 Tax=Rosa chinensis TaxID=74649 RepID=A0A2P6QML7_ROSCH|nr:hypothetical protein RchiOBHm_Chr5g0079961 [Rosa chinensis]